MPPAAPTLAAVSPGQPSPTAPRFPGFRLSATSLASRVPEPLLRTKFKKGSGTPRSSLRTQTRKRPPSLGLAGGRPRVADSKASYFCQPGRAFMELDVAAAGAGAAQIPTGVVSGRESDIIDVVPTRLTVVGDNDGGGARDVINQNIIIDRTGEWIQPGYWG